MSSWYITKSSDTKYILDLSLWTNPVWPSKKLLQQLKNKDISEILTWASNYSKEVFERSTKELILEAFEMKWLDDSCMEFNPNGSYQLWDEMIRMLKQMGRNELLAPNYSFPNVSQWCIRHGMKYTPVPWETMSPKDSLLRIQNINDLAKKIVYIDYPHNPMGSFDEELTKKTIEYVSSQWWIIILDIAYGEVLPNIKKMMQYTTDRWGIVLWSLSKTQWLPDLRAWRGMIAPNIINTHYNGDERMVFNLSSLSRLVCKMLFEKWEDWSIEAFEHAKKSAEYNKRVNTKLYQILNKNWLEVLKTSLLTPIQTITSQSWWLYERMLNAWIHVENLTDRQITLSDEQKEKWYKNNAVRMRTPKEEELDTLEDLLKNI